MLLDRGRIIGAYQVERQLGQGGLAEVYLATHRVLGTRHAIKVLQVPSRRLQARLVREGRVQAHLQHPNVLAVRDVIEVDGAPGLVMEFVDGPNLSELLRRRRLTHAQADVLAHGILAGVAAAHDAGVVHRDLKPANILLEPGANGPIAKVADFGLVKLLDEDDAPDDGAAGGAQTRSGTTMGTPRYMAPEQMRDAKNVDERADVFALGAILYELYTGSAALQGQDLIELYDAAIKGERPALADASPQLTAPQREAIERALNPDVQARPAQAGALLQAWLAPPPKGVSWAGVEGVSRGGTSAGFAKVPIAPLDAQPLPTPTPSVHAAWPPDAGRAPPTSVPADPTFQIGDEAPDGPSPTLVAPSADLDPVGDGSDGVPVTRADPATQPSPTDPSPTETNGHDSRRNARALYTLALTSAAIFGLWYALQPQPFHPITQPDPIPHAPLPKTQPPADAPALAAPVNPDKGTPDPPIEVSPSPPKQPRVTPTARTPDVPEPAGTLRIAGNATEAWLIDAVGQRIGPGAHAPGEYSVKARFEAGGDTYNFGPYTLTDGATLTLTCYSEDLLCGP